MLLSTTEGTVPTKKGDINITIPEQMLMPGKRSGGGTGATDIYYSSTSSTFMGKDPKTGEMVPMVAQVTVRSVKKYDVKKK